MVTASSSAAPRAAALGQKTKRPGALVPNIALWSIIVGAVVIVAHVATAGFGQRIGPYWSGLITLILFIGVGLYSVRKRYLWISIRLVRLATAVASPLKNLMVMMDRLESWRAVHVTVGVLALLPFWWHMQTGLRGPLETTLLAAVVLLFLSGFCGVFMQQYFPHAMTRRAEHEVRLKDVDGRIAEVVAQAPNEKSLGHLEAVVMAYSRNIDPILRNDTPQSALLWATIRGADAGDRVASEGGKIIPRLEQELVAQLEKIAELKADPDKLKAKLSEELSAYRDLLALAARKVNLEQNGLNLRLSTGWLVFHIVLSAAVGVLVLFHVFAVLYFYGA